MSDRRENERENDLGSDDATHEALARHFAAVIASAPPLPERVRSLPARRSRLTLVISVAAALVLLPAIVHFARRGSDASAAELVERAAQRFAELRDAKVQITFESAALDAVEAMFSKERHLSDPANTQVFVALVKAPSRFLLWKLPAPGASTEGLTPCTGFDGTTAWAFDSDVGVVEVKSVDEWSGLGDVDLTRYLSFGFVRDLVAQKGSYDVIETTGAFDERVDRRAFRLVRRRADDAETKIVWTTADLVIDPDTDLIERCAVDVSMGPLSLLRVRMETIAVNDGVSDATFGYRSHVPNDTPVRATVDVGDVENVEIDSTADSRGVDIRGRTGLSFAVLESIVRRRVTSTKTPYGFKIRAVDPDSPASRAGLRAGDILLRWNGEPVKSLSDVQRWLRVLEPGASVRLDVSRLKNVSIWSRHPWEDLEITLVVGK